MIFPMINWYVAPDCLWLSPTISNHPWQFLTVLTVSECLQLSPTIPNYPWQFPTVLTVADHPRLSPIVSDCTLLFSTVSKGPRMSLTVPKRSWPYPTAGICGGPWGSLGVFGGLFCPPSPPLFLWGLLRSSGVLGGLWFFSEIDLF